MKKRNNIKCSVCGKSYSGDRVRATTGDKRKFVIINIHPDQPCKKGISPRYLDEVIRQEEAIEAGKNRLKSRHPLYTRFRRLKLKTSTKSRSPPYLSKTRQKKPTITRRKHQTAEPRTKHAQRAKKTRKHGI